MAVTPKADTGNPYNRGLAAVRMLTPQEMKLHNDFSQAFWFAIAKKLLPSPGDAQRFHEAILNWTGRELLEI